MECIMFFARGKIVKIKHVVLELKLCQSLQSIEHYLVIP